MERNPNRERLPEDVVNRVLNRATALDAQHGASVPVDVLRAAARDAGISEQAFEAALAEERRGVLASPPRRVFQRKRFLVVAAVGAVLIAIPPLFLVLRSPSRTMSVDRSAVEETFLLRCADQEATASRIRRNVREKGSVRLWYNSKETRVLHVSARPEIMTKIRAEIAAAEVDAPTCAAPPG